MDAEYHRRKIASAVYDIDHEAREILANGTIDTAVYAYERAVNDLRHALSKFKEDAAAKKAKRAQS